MGTDGSRQGKDDIHRIMKDDHTQKRAWSEVSGAPEKMATKIGMPKVPSTRAKELTGKSDIRPVAGDEHRYVRKIGDADREKVIMGHPKG
jgi:hypothetical protein